MRFSCSPWVRRFLAFCGATALLLLGISAHAVVNLENGNFYIAYDDLTVHESTGLSEGAGSAPGSDPGRSRSAISDASIRLTSDREAAEGDRKVREKQAADIRAAKEARDRAFARIKSDQEAETPRSETRRRKDAACKAGDAAACPGPN